MFEESSFLRWRGDLTIIKAHSEARTASFFAFPILPHPYEQNADKCLHLGIAVCIGESGVLKVVNTRKYSVFRN